MNIMRQQLVLKTFSPEIIKKWSKELIFGLDYLHKNNIIHREIRPALVFHFIIIINLKYNFFILYL